MSNDRHKYRIWDKKDEEYLDPDYYEGCYLLPNGKPYVGMTIYNGLYEEYQVIPPQQLIVEQSTGLADKNGKLTFDGDVIQENGINRYIHWHDGGWCYSVRYDSKCHWHLRKEDVENAAIIGTIHNEQFRDLAKKDGERQQ